jgi:hypothetical protein
MAMAKSKAKFYAVDFEGTLVMPAKRFIRLTHVPKALLPNDYRPVTLKQLSRLFGVDLRSFYDLADLIERKGIPYACDNSYNFGWWGPTVSFKKARLSDNTLVVIGMHCGGDVRSNYRWHYFLVDRPYHEVSPWHDIFGSVALVAEVKHDGNEFTATATDLEGYDWEIYPDTPENRQIWERVIKEWW